MLGVDQDPVSEDGVSDCSTKSIQGTIVRFMLLGRIIDLENIYSIDVRILQMAVVGTH